jgi:GT2 family glycosyltransferase
MVTYPHANTVSHNFMSSMMDMDRRHVYQIIPTRGYPGTGLILARNAAVGIFLRSDAEWLWTLDTDIGFEPMALDKLLEHGDKYGVISGFYKTICETGTRWLDGSVSYKELPLALQEVDGGRFREYPNYEGSMEVDAVGAGCLLVHRSVFEATPDGGWYDTIGGLGEDISFCVKARALGYKILCDTTISLSHHKAVWLRNE